MGAMIFSLRMKPDRNKIYRYALAVFFMIGFHQLAFSQNDSLTIYHKLQGKADKHKVTSWIFDAIFVDPDNIPVEEDSIIIAHSIRSVKITNPYLMYANKPIRSIKVEVLDPFGNSVNDTFKRPSQGIQKVGNQLHLTTREKTIRNLLLFREGDAVDPIRLSESERLLRVAPYINDARIFVKGKETIIKGKKKKVILTDSIDIIVRVHDKWSIEPESNLDINSPNLIVTESNLGGIGHTVYEGVYYDGTRHILGNTGGYGIYNIQRSYINSALFYYTDNLRTQVGINFDRPFFSPLAKWGGGLLFSKSFSTYLFIDSVQNNMELKLPTDYTYFDTWVGKNFRVGNKKKLKDKVSNVFTGMRYVDQQYQKRPEARFDIYNELRNQHLYLANVGFSKIKYYKERYISRFGANEDIPLGFTVQLIGGYRQLERDPDRYYTGVSFTNGHLFRSFYLQSTLTYGSFQNKNSTQKGVASVELFSFSNLMQFGTWYFRQFVRFKYVEGINRDVQENITINAAEMNGFSSAVLLGKSKAIVNLQTIIYLPYNIAGFKFAPILMFGFGQVGNKITDVFFSRVYQSYGLGLLVRNENLLFNTFEISLSVYPYVPGETGNQFGGSFSSGRNTNFGNFNVGRPDVLPYY